MTALLQAGAKGEVNFTFGANEESALHVAAACGAEKVSKALLLAGADPITLERHEVSPLHLAARYGHDGVVDTLLLKGADPNAGIEHHSDTPLL